MRHDSYLPSSPATLQALDRMGYAMVNAIAPPDVRIVGPHFKVPSHSPSVPGYIQKFDPWVPPFVKLPTPQSFPSSACVVLLSVLCICESWSLRQFPWPLPCHCIVRLRLCRSSSRAPMPVRMGKLGTKVTNPVALTDATVYLYRFWFALLHADSCLHCRFSLMYTH